MLAIQKSKSYQGKCVPNVLPCRINHNGPVDASKRYWNPVVKGDKMISYFRGRKLYARKLKLPKGHKGVVASRTDIILPTTKSEVAEEHEDEDEEMGEEVKMMEDMGTFEEIVVWGHEAVMDEGDPYVRAVEEWIGLAESIHASESEEMQTDTTAK